jgi:hypothetical protein
MAFYLSPISTILQYFTDIGVVLAGGKVNTYLAGTTTPTTTWTDITGATPNSNPIILNSAGRLPNTQIWQQGGVPIKVIITDANNNLIGPTFDQISGIDDIAVTNALLGNPASGDGADLVANAMRSYDIFASARSANVPILQSGQTLIVDFEGGVTIADGLGGLFYWNASSTANDDAINVIKPTSLSGAGRYLRLNQYIEFFAVKNAVTSRASNTTPAIDPDLQLTIPAGGTYVIKGWLNDASGTSAGGLKGSIAFSGSISTGLWGMNGNGTAVSPVPLTNINTTATLQTAQTAVGNMPLNGALLCTTAGTLSFNWSQNSSNSTASVLGPGSYLRATRVSSATGGFTPVTHSYNTAGSGNETIPVGASTVTIEAFGGPGGGNAGSGTGCGVARGPQGGSGGYVLSVLNVSTANGQTINFTVGQLGGTGGTAGTASTVSSGSYSLTTMTAGGGAGGGAGGSSGTGGAGGTAAGGNTTNTTGNAGRNGATLGGGGSGSGIVGINGTGGNGGQGGLGSVQLGSPGSGPGLIVFKYT